MKHTLTLIGISIAAGIVFSGFLFNVAGQTAGVNSPLPGKVDYNWDIRPILSENCFRCHGPDEKARRVGLRLDVPEGAYTVIERGKSADSELFQRVSSADANYRMPPPEAKKQLTDRQIAILKRWIDQGAEYKPHWAFIPPQKNTLPTAKLPGIVNDIDRFVFSRLERDGLRPSPEADKETLINRASMTLTGLPPSLQEVDAFIADKTPNAYERLVDRLLASPAYGEQMAASWMNVARYAETDGFLDDHHNRLLWPYRDWVISAFNKNMPFDRFSIWQLAGDLLPNRTKEQTLATTFLRLGKRTTENGAIHEEYRVEYMLERTDLIGKAFLGLTVGCARCHDHKYDPISNKGYYEMTGFFNSVAEPGFYAPGQSTVQGGPTLLWTTVEQDLQLAGADADIKAQEAAYAAARRAAMANATARAEALLTGPVPALADRIRESLDAATTAYYSFETVLPFVKADGTTLRDLLPSPRARGQAPPELLEGSGSVFGAVQAGQRGGAGQRGLVPPNIGQQGQQGVAPPPLQAPAGGRGQRGNGLPLSMVAEKTVIIPNEIRSDTHALVEAPIFKAGPAGKGQALYFDDTNQGFLGKDIGWFERSQEFSFDLWLRAPKVYEAATVINHRDEDNAGGKGYSLDLENNHIRFKIMHSWPFNMLSVASKQAVPVNEWVHVAVTYDGSSRVAGLKLYMNGKPAELDVEQDNLTRTILPTGFGQVFDQFVGVSFGKKFRLTGLVGGGIDEIRVFNRQLEPLEVSYLHDEKTAIASGRDALRQQLADLLLVNDPGVEQAKNKLGEVREAQNKIVSVIPEVLVMGDMPNARPTYMLDRGLYNARGEQVKPQALSTVFPWKNSLPQNRLGLAQWLFDPAHPLTARVFVNRLWQTHFGRGLVDTPDDFGSQGSIPTHPELLDYLAVRFVESGWDIKAMQKLMVMSATYRQQSEASEELIGKDPENRLFARGLRQRMSAEMIRDYALSISGLLVPKIGGPSVHPYQPDGVWEAAAAAGSPFRYPRADQVDPEEHHRRTLYSYIKRNAPHPEMAVFDFPDRSTSTVNRRISNTPLQSLALLDDPQYVEAFRVLAANVLRSTADKDAQLRRIYRLAARRLPTNDELAALRRFYDSQLARFGVAKEDADALLKIGMTPVDPNADAAQIAALTNVAAVVMNTPDAYSIH